MLTKLPGILLVLTALLLSACTENKRQITAAADQSLLIQNAVLYDGSGAAPFKGGLRVQKGVIVSVGDLTPLDGEEIWDAKGLALAPGFIDPHGHYRTKLSQQPAPASVLAQGITTITVGADGEAVLPIKDMFASFEKNPAAINMAAFGPHSDYRSTVMGDDYRRAATLSEIDQMITLFQADLDEGVLGLSTGLEYDPAVYSITSELIALSKVAARVGGRYTSHMRNEDVDFYPALEEVITIAREAHIPVNISHIKIATTALWGLSSKAIGVLNAARVEGINITADIYPYDGWQTTMRTLLPKRDFDDRAAYEYALTSIISPSAIILSQYEPNPSYIGKTLAEISEEEGLDPVDMLMKMVKVTVSGKKYERIIGRNMGEEDIRRFMQWPFTSISTDGSIDDNHPRGQGAFPRVLAKYVREKGILSLPETIRKMTSLTAQTLGLTDRGSLKTGYAADLVLFDPENITDHGTFTDPVQYATGVKAVWVNGTLVWQNGKATASRPGKILRRAQENK